MIEMTWEELRNQLDGVTTITNDRKTEGVTVNGTTANIYNVKVSGESKFSTRFPDTLLHSDLTGIDTGNVTSMQALFYGCSKLTTLDLSTWNTSNVTSMATMFFQCESLTSLNLSNFYTGKVTNMFAMFGNCYKLTSLDLSTWNTSNVTSAREMFGGLNGANIKVGKGWTLDITPDAYLGNNLTFDVTDTEPNKPVTPEPEPIEPEPEPEPTETDLYDEYIWLGDKYEILGRKRVSIDLSEYVKRNDVVDVVEKDNLAPVSSNAISKVLPVIDDKVEAGNKNAVTSNAVANIASIIDKGEQFVKFANGLLIQWGQFSASGSSHVRTVTLPQPFINTSYNFTPTNSGTGYSGTVPSGVGVTIKTNRTVEINTIAWAGEITKTPKNIYYLAIGWWK